MNANAIKLVAEIISQKPEVATSEEIGILNKSSQYDLSETMTLDARVAAYVYLPGKSGQFVTETADSDPLEKRLIAAMQKKFRIGGGLRFTNGSFREVRIFPVVVIDGETIGRFATIFDAKKVRDWLRELGYDAETSVRCEKAIKSHLLMAPKKSDS
jgi:hypothetical protein